ncbi:MAG: hypothetical protein II528_09550, partial [Lachnospiraceae bacterium]|nr:hypothetical protein [Lachnospiraceae bacterium]
MRREEQIPVWMLIGILLLALLCEGGSALYETYGIGMLVLVVLFLIGKKCGKLRLFCGRLWIPTAFLFGGSILALCTTTSHGMAFLGIVKLLVLS